MAQRENAVYKVMVMIVMMTVGCGFEFDLEGRCFAGESYPENQHCPRPGMDGSDSIDGLEAIDAADATDSGDGTDGLDMVVDGTDTVDGLDATDGTSDGTNGTESIDATDGTEPVDSEDSGTDVTDSTDGTETPMCVTDTDCVDDGNACTKTKCDPGGECVHSPNSDPCNDGSACTAGDVCSEGACVGVAIACNDQNPCTTDTCNNTNGCVFTANMLACEDNNPCTTSDTCLGGTCHGGPNMCTCQSTADCASHNDENLCNGSLVCQMVGGVGNCVINESSVVVCDNTNDSDCLAATCTPATGLCSLQPINDGIACADADACTVLETCTNGVCSGLARTCDDDDLCTGSESCDPATGCIPGSPLACDDGQTCNGLETCVTLLGGCVPGQEKNCNDNDPCTSDVCDTTQNDCVNTANALDCNDLNPCTFDVCVKGFGCVHQASPALAGISCNDDNACTTSDACDENGVCVGSKPVVCTAASQCHTAGVCNPLTGICSTPAAADGTGCDDNHGCTTDDACFLGECQGQPMVCNPDSCHLDATCDDTDGVGKCVQGKNRCQPDGDTCTWDLCDLKVGCYTINTGSKPGFQLGWCGSGKENLDDDVCPLAYNDADLDNDGVCEAYVAGCPNCPGGYGDNAPQFQNPDQKDTDNDGIGDVMDPDVDGDGVCDPGWPTFPYGSCGEFPPP